WPASAAISMRRATGRSWASIAPCRKIFSLSGDVSNMNLANLLPAEQGVAMSQFFQIHPENPQARLIKQAVEIIRNGGVVVCPTDSPYATGCAMGNTAAIERIRRLRQLDDKHNFTLACRDLSQLGLFAKVDTVAFRLLKTHLPGPYTIILNATREVPRMLLHPKRRTIGLRVPAQPIAQALLAELGEPLMSVSLILPGESEPMSDPYEMRDALEHQVDLIIDGGYGGVEASTVISLVDGEPEVLRVGCGDPQPFMA